MPCGNSEIVYHNFWGNVALQYSIGSSEIEELISLNKKTNDYSFVFKINSAELEVSLDETGNVSFCSPENGEVFGFSAPIMTDANGNTSAAVSYRTIESDGARFIVLTADSAWINQESTILPVQIKTTIHVKDNEDGFQKDRLEAQEKVKERENILRMNADTLPDYYTLTSASLKYHYETADNSKLGVIKVPEKSARVDLSEIYLPIEKAVPAKKKAKKIHTEITKIDVADIKGEKIAFGFSPIGQDETAFVYSEGERAAVLSLRYNLNVGLGPRAVTEQFGGDGIENYINVYTRQLTSVIDCMSVNSNILPIQLQMVYNPSYDSYKSNLLNLSDFAYPIEGMGKNFKLNLEQYCFSYEIDRYHDGFIYIDGSGAVHEFEENIRSTSSANHYVCKDCNLTCSKAGNHSVTIYKNNVPYMYFTYGRLTWIATPEKSLRIEYELLNNGKARIEKVYNCLEGGTRNYPSSKEAQSVTFAYNNNNLLSSITSNYGESVNFTYNDRNLLTKIERGTLSIANLEYDSANRIESIIGKHRTGCQFYYSTNYEINLLRAINTDNTANTIESAAFSSSTTTKSVELSRNGAASVIRQYAFNDSGICQSSYQGYYNQQDDTCPRNTVAVYAEQQADKVRTKTALCYTEDFSQLYNGSFRVISGTDPSDWVVDTTNSGNNYVERNGGNLLYLTEKSTAWQKYWFSNDLKTSYVVGFYAEAEGNDCSLKVTLSGKNISKTFAVNSNGQYYAFIAFDRSTSSNRGTLKFENICSSHAILIDNVTISPIDEYVESVWNGVTATQADKQITQETTYTADTGDDNRLKKETVIDHYTCNGTSTANAATVTKTYTYTDAAKEGETSKQEILSTVKYRENGSIKTAMQKVVNENSGLTTKTITTYTDADGSTSQTAVGIDMDIYGNPLMVIGENGEKTYYIYSNTQNNYRLIQQINCNETKLASVGDSHSRHFDDYIVSYTYNEYGECSSVSDGTSANSVTDNYNGTSDQYSGSGQSWKTEFNTYGNPTAIYDENDTQHKIQYTYDEDQRLKKVNYDNSSAQSIKDVGYDKYGNSTYIVWNEKINGMYTLVAAYTFSYDYENYKYSVSHSGNSYNYQYNYNNDPLQMQTKVSGGGYVGEYTYICRSDGLLASASYTINGTTRIYTPQYNEKKQIISESDGSNFKSSYSYNEKGALEEYSVSNGTKTVLKNSYYYDGINTIMGSQYKTRRITDEKIADDSSYARHYEYDAMGRVESIRYNRMSVNKYSYDKANRLSSETERNSDGKLGYSYDNRNNITQIRRSSPSNQMGTVLKKFTYGETNRLESYTNNGVTKYFVYDGMGNPVKYGVSNVLAADNMIWTQATKLKSGTYKGNRFSYKYNADGLRYEKTVNGITTRQYLEGDKIIAEEDVNASGTIVHTKYYIYDHTGIAGMVYDGTTYYFAKNMFGDVVSVHTETGAYAAGYEYDAWGNITSGGGSGIGAANPFRYRGYYYDNETGFYYLQSRYYDPEIYRFINADNLELIPSLSQIPGQLNLYAYCNNNPLMYTDETGEIALTTAILIGMGIGAAVGLGIGIGLGLANGARGWDLVGYIVLGTCSGIIAGGVIAATIFTGGAAMNLGYEMFKTGLAVLAGGGGGTAGGALAVAGVGVMAAGSVVVVGGTAVGLLGANIMFSQTPKSNGYYGERWPGDPHKPDHVHLRGNGVDIRIGRDGNPLPGENSLSAQAKKALRKLWPEFEKLFRRW